MPLRKSAGPVVGLDIGSAFIKACELDAKGGRANLRGIAVIPTPVEAMANNEITDPVALGKAIKLVLKQSGIKCPRVVTCVAGQSSLVVRIIEVPKMTRAELQETMKWEIERHVPFAAEQVVMDYQPLIPPEDVPDGQNMEVLLAVAQEALVTRHIEAITAAGLRPVAIDIEPLASSRSLIDLANGSGPTGTVAVVDIGASTTDISIYREGRIAFTRSIQLAGNNLTKAISDILAQPLADAERLKMEVASIPDQPQAQAVDDGGAFGDDFGALPQLDFGEGGVPLGGTFGSNSPAPGTETQAESTFDIAGGGISADMFTMPSTDAAPGTSPFDPAPAEATLSGPVPSINPFDPEAGLPGAVAAAPEPASPFEASVFGDAMGADPFGGGPDFGAFGGQASGGAAPSGMSDEEYLRTHIADAIMPVLHELVTELRRSLDFYANRANGLGAQQVIVCGGTAKLPGIADFLRANLGVEVTLGNPLQFLTAGPKSDANYLQDVGPIFSVAVGLAVRELLMEPPPVRTKGKKR